jgi:hypothetical protein
MQRSEAEDARVARTERFSTQHEAPLNNAAHTHEALVDTTYAYETRSSPHLPDPGPKALVTNRADHLEAGTRKSPRRPL